MAEQLEQISGRRLPKPYNNARKLQQVAGVGAKDFSPLLPEMVADAVQRVMDITMGHVSYLESQIQQVEQWIAEEADGHPGVACQASIPGIGPVFSSGIAAEIGDIQRFLQGTKWNRKHKRYCARNLRDAEDAVAKIAGLWWPRYSSGDFEAEERRMAKSGNRYLRYYLIQAANQMRYFKKTTFPSMLYFMHANIGKHPNIITSGRWFSRPARAWVSWSGCYTAKRTTARRRLLRIFAAFASYVGQ